MSADLHAALSALADEFKAMRGERVLALDVLRVGEGSGLGIAEHRLRAILAAHPATDADLIREAEQRGAAAAVERVEVVLAQHWDWKAGRSLYAAVRAAVRATEED